MPALFDSVHLSRCATGCLTWLVDSSVKVTVCWSTDSCAGIEQKSVSKHGSLT